jgi:spoIIIJ-associated protein
MKREAIATGHTVEDAIDTACNTLGVERDKVEFEILELPAKRLLGLLGASEAKVKVVFEESVEERAKVFLAQLLENMDLPGIMIDSTEKEDNILLNIEGEGLGVIIGHRGETLDAMQYLVSLVANKGEEQYKRITIDTGSYREKREKTLISLARRIAINSVKTHRSTTLEPMNPYERRIIHTAVQEINGASSWSVGEDPNRRVVIGTGNGNAPYTRDIKKPVH